ncbi:MAG: phosphate ABC transporter permease subunit PstC [Planctomycetota bacterium]|nr:MAG: phosphate ABC transporter permease subunit PstC [Planctomycetota bacterium]
MQNLELKPAVDKYQPLVLTPLEDIRGFLFHHLGRFLLFLITFSSVLLMLLIFFFVIREAIPFLMKFNLTEFLTTKSWYPEASTPKFGALSLIVGSLYVTIAALVFAVPTGILAAIFLSDIVSLKIGDFIKPVIEILAAIPSVAYGFFAVLVLAPWMQNKLGFTTGTNALNASIILSIMALPTIISVAEDSISTIGRELREASYALGATRFETIFKVVIPAAHSGIIAAIVLGMMRAIGETMVVWMASGNANQIPSPWWDLSQSVRTMTATIAGDMGETPKDSLHYGALFAIGVVLLVMTFLLNIISEYFLASAKRKSGKS